MPKIAIECGKVRFEVILNQTKTAQAILEALPINSAAQRWGEEIYFEIPVRTSNEIPTLEVSVGDVGYWPEGHCFCIFFGKTPASKGNTPRPASEVTLIGRTESPASLLTKVKDGDEVHLSKS